jgi:hypothetical protein
MTTKLTPVEIVAIEIIDGLDRLAIRYNRDPELKRSQKEFVMKTISEFTVNGGTK